MHFRPYEPTDAAACLAIFDSNLPAFFASNERAGFAQFLAKPAGLYFVVETKDRENRNAWTGDLMACGGYWINPAAPMASLTWGMVARSYHGQGIGRWLLLQRLEQIRADPTIDIVRLDTSQHIAGFFAKFGFQTAHVITEGYGPGLDTYEMSLPLTEKGRGQVRRWLMDTEVEQQDFEQA